MATVVDIDNVQPARGESRWVVVMGEDAEDEFGEEVDVNARTGEEAKQAASEWAKTNLVKSCQTVVAVHGPMFGLY